MLPAQGAGGIDDRGHLLDTQTVHLLIEPPEVVFDFFRIKPVEFLMLSTPTEKHSAHRFVQAIDSPKTTLRLGETQLSCKYNRLFCDISYFVSYTL